MATTDTNSDDFDVSDASLDKRAVRALVEKMTVLSKDAPGMYDVVTESGSSYVVDARHGSCDCPDATHRDVKCKHIRRARYAIGRTTIPTWVNMDVVDEQLGDQVDEHPVMADGGRLFREARDRYETERIDGGVLVYDRDEDELGRRLVGFSHPDGSSAIRWDKVRDELARLGLGVGAIQDKEVFEPQEVGL